MLRFVRKKKKQNSKPPPPAVIKKDVEEEEKPPISPVSVQDIRKGTVLVVHLSDGTHRSLVVDKTTTARHVIGKIVERLSAQTSVEDFQLYVQFQFGYGRLLNDDNVLSELSVDCGSIVRVSLWNKEKKKTRTMSTEGFLSHSLSTWSLDELTFRGADPVKEDALTNRRNTVDFESTLSNGISSEHIAKQPELRFSTTNGTVDQSWSSASPSPVRVGSPQRLAQGAEHGVQAQAGARGRGIQHRPSTLHRNTAMRRVREPTAPIVVPGSQSNVSLPIGNSDPSVEYSHQSGVQARRRSSLWREMLVRQGSAPQNMHDKIVHDQPNDALTDDRWAKTQSVPNSPCRNQTKSTNGHGNVPPYLTPSQSQFSDNCSSGTSQSNLDNHTLRRTPNGPVKASSFTPSIDYMREAFLKAGSTPSRESRGEYFDRLVPTATEDVYDFDRLDLSLRSDNGAFHHPNADQMSPTLKHSISLENLTSGISSLESLNGSPKHAVGPPKPPRAVSHMYNMSGSGTIPNGPPKPTRGPTPLHIRQVIDKWNNGTQSYSGTLDMPKSSNMLIDKYSPYATMSGNLSYNNNNNNSNNNNNNNTNSNSNNNNNNNTNSNSNSDCTECQYDDLECEHSDSLKLKDQNTKTDLDVDLYSESCDSMTCSLLESTSAYETQDTPVSAAPKRLIGLRRILFLDYVVPNSTDNNALEEEEEEEGDDAFANSQTDLFAGCDFVTSSAHPRPTTYTPSSLSFGVPAVDLISVDSTPLNKSLLSSNSLSPTAKYGMMSRVRFTSVSDEVFKKQFNLSKGQRLRKRTDVQMNVEPPAQITSEEAHLLCAYALGHLFDPNRITKSSKHSGLTTGPPPVPKRTDSLRDSLLVSQCKQLAWDLHKCGALQDLNSTDHSKFPDGNSISSTLSLSESLPVAASAPLLFVSAASPIRRHSVSQPGSALHDSLNDVSLSPADSETSSWRKSTIRQAFRMRRKMIVRNSPPSVSRDSMYRVATMPEDQPGDARSDESLPYNSCVPTGHLLAPIFRFDSSTCDSLNSLCSKSQSEATISPMCLISPSQVNLHVPRSPLFNSTNALSNTKTASNEPTQNYSDQDMSSFVSSPSLFSGQDDIDGVSRVPQKTMEATGSVEKETHYATLRRHKTTPAVTYECPYCESDQGCFFNRLVSASNERPATGHSEMPEDCNLDKLSLSLKSFEHSCSEEGGGAHGYSYIVWYKGDQYTRVWHSQTGDYRIVAQ